MMTRTVDSMQPGLPREGMWVSLDNDGGLTIKAPSGLVLSVIDKGDVGVTVEGYAYHGSEQAAHVDPIDPQFLRNPRSIVHVWTVVPRPVGQGADE